MIKIMLVDDETSFTATLGERLLLRGYEVFMAQNGKQAVSMMIEKGPHVVLLDLSLPDIDGLEVMEKLKEIDSGVEVIVVSGHGMEHQTEVMKKGAFSYATKPVKLTDLVELIKSAFKYRAAKATEVV